MNKFEQVVQTQNTSMTSLPKPGMMEMGTKTVTAIGLAGSCEIGAPNTSMVPCRRIWGVRPHWCSSISWRKQPLGCNSGITRKLLLYMGCGRKELISPCLSYCLSENLLNRFFHDHLLAHSPPYWETPVGI